MLKDMTIKKRLIVLSMVSMVVITLYALKVIYEDYKKYEDATSVIKGTELSVKLSNLLHEFQKERGASAGFLSSKGAKFKETLKNQRVLTDQKIKVLQNYLATHNDRFAELAKKSIDLSKLQLMRKRVDALKVSTKEAVGYYTAINTSLIDTVAKLSTQVSDPKLRNLMNSLVLFISAKERAGIERAVLSGAFSKDNFDRFLYAKFISVLAQQKALFHLFEVTADEKLKKFYASVRSDPAFAEVQRMRDIALNRERGFGVDAAYWFKTITKKINGLKKMENFIQKEITSRSAEVKSGALVELAAISILSLLITLLIGYTSKSVTNSIVLSIRRLTGLIEQVNSGNLAFEIERRHLSRN